MKSERFDFNNPDHVAALADVLKPGVCDLMRKMEPAAVVVQTANALVDTLKQVTGDPMLAMSTCMATGAKLAAWAASTEEDRDNLLKLLQGHLATNVTAAWSDKQRYLEERRQVIRDKLQRKDGGAA